MDLIINLWIKHLSPFISYLWDSIILWRTVSLILFSIFIIASINRKKIYTWLSKSKIVDHDKNIFTQSNKILSETQLNDILSLLTRDHSYTIKSTSSMENYYHFLNEQQNQYLVKKIMKASNILNSSLINLLKFLAYNFFFYPKNQNERQCLHPYWNIDREGDADTKENRQKYEDQVKELYKHVDSVKKSYKSYRSEIKQNLFV